MTAPFFFKVIEKPKIWGLERWLLSGLSGDESVTTEGVPLAALIREMKGDLLGAAVYARFGAHFPLLVKFLDARQTLSVQVHPDDERARRVHQSLGKDEMWYLLACDEGATIKLGFKEPLCTEEEKRLLLSDGAAFAETLAAHRALKERVFSLPAGTVHAIGAGVRLLEVQEASDITYRVYDYDRVGADGKKRPLHRRQALETIDFSCRGAEVRYEAASGNVELVRRPLFVVNRVLVKGATELPRTVDSFRIVLPFEGNLSVNGVPCARNEVALLPACEETLRLEGDGKCLTVVTDLR